MSLQQLKAVISASFRNGTMGCFVMAIDTHFNTHLPNLSERGQRDSLGCMDSTITCPCIQETLRADVTGKQIDFTLYPVITISVCGFKIALTTQKGEESFLLILSLR